MEMKIFWVLFEIELWMVITQWSRLSPNLHSQYTNIADFKANFHNLSIQKKKDPTRTWHKLPYLATEEDIMGVINKFLSEWLTPSNEDAGKSKATKGETGKTTVATVAKKDKEKEA